MTLSFNQAQPKWLWPKMPKFGIMEVLLCVIISVFVYLMWTNAHPPKLDTEESLVQYAATTSTGTETQSVVDVIDLKIGQKLDGNPVFYLVMQQVDPKFDEFTFIAEASPTEAYKYLGYRLRVNVVTPKSTDNIGSRRDYVPAQDWQIDSVYSPRSRLNSEQ